MASFTFEQPGAAVPIDAGSASSATGGADSAAWESGPGWYDSSWELQRGLIVREGLPRDASLHEWLQHELCGASEQGGFELGLSRC